jgi:hypothetical protein
MHHNMSWLKNALPCIGSDQPQTSTGADAVPARQARPVTEHVNLSHRERGGCASFGVDSAPRGLMPLQPAKHHERLQKKRLIKIQKEIIGELKKDIPPLIVEKLGFKSIGDLIILMVKNNAPQPRSIMDDNKLNCELVVDLIDKLMVHVKRVADELEVNTAQAAEIIIQCASDQRTVTQFELLNDSPKNIYFDHIILCLRSIREASTERDQLQHAMQQHPKFASFPIESIWKMAIDVGKESESATQGWAAFETESGYMAGIYRGLAFVLKADLENKALDAEFVADLHDTALQGVLSTQLLSGMDLSQVVPESKPGDKYKLSSLAATVAKYKYDVTPPFYIDQYLLKEGFHTPNPGAEPGCFGVGAIYGSMTPRGFAQACERLSQTSSHTLLVSGQKAVIAPQFNSDRNRYVAEGMDKISAVRRAIEPFKVAESDAFNPESGYVFFTNLPWQKTTPKEKVNQILSAYKAETNEAQTETEKLTAIARCCQNLNQAHPFADGNARTFGVLLVNRLLLKEGLGPAIMEDANRFDGYAVDELVDEIRKGQASFQSFIVGDSSRIEENDSSPQPKEALI